MLSARVHVARHGTTSARDRRKFQTSLAVLTTCSVLSANAPAQMPTPDGTAPGLRIDEPVTLRPMTVPLLGRPVELTGYWEFTHEERKDFDLDRTRARNRRIDEHELKLNARTRPAPDTEVLLQLVGAQESRQTQGSSIGQHTASLQRGQAWVRFDNLLDQPLSLQIGRIALVEPRAWWWDEDLDAVRLRFEQGPWRLDTGMAKELARVSSADDGMRPEVAGIVRWFGHGTWTWAPRHSVQAFWLLARDRSGTPTPGSRFGDDDSIDASDLNARWIGVRAIGQWRRPDGIRLAYWADRAIVRGRETVTDFDDGDSPVATGSRERGVRGHAFDIGAALSLPGQWRPTFSVSHARGSGGGLGADADDGFRQTGLQENKARRSGAKRMALYGELLRPELSNLAVTSIGAGVRLRERSSIEVVAHRYRQRNASAELLGSRLSADPLGNSPDIGTEYDIKFAWREWRQFELTLTWASFRPGAAFATSRRTPARLFEIGIAMSF